MQHSSGFLKISEEAKKVIQEIDLPTLENLVEAGEEFYLVDVREAEEYSKGCISRAIHLSKGVIERDIESIIPDKKAKIVLYCGGGHRSALAAENLQRMGYSNVYSLIGGYRSACASERLNG